VVVRRFMVLLELLSLLVLLSLLLLLLMQLPTFNQHSGGSTPLVYQYSYLYYL
jgi:hypothetical protein